MSFIVFEKPFVMSYHSGRSRIWKRHCMIFIVESKKWITTFESFDRVLTVKFNQVVKEEGNGLFNPLVISYIRGFHSILLHVYADFKGEVYLYLCSAPLYFKRTRDCSAFSGFGPRYCMSIQACSLQWVYLIAVMYQGYCQSKEGDCQALGLVVYNWLKFCYFTCSNRVYNGFIEHLGGYVISCSVMEIAPFMEFMI